MDSLPLAGGLSLHALAVILDAYGAPLSAERATPCDHGVQFDAEAARGLDANEVRKRWPRGFGNCPKGCGFNGIAYASFEHYTAGDW